MFLCVWLFFAVIFGVRSQQPYRTIVISNGEEVSADVLNTADEIVSGWEFEITIRGNINFLSDVKLKLDPGPDVLDELGIQFYNGQRALVMNVIGNGVPRFESVDLRFYSLAPYFENGACMEPTLSVVQEPLPVALAVSNYTARYAVEVKLLPSSLCFTNDNGTGDETGGDTAALVAAAVTLSVLFLAVVAVIVFFLVRKQIFGGDPGVRKRPAMYPTDDEIEPAGGVGQSLRKRSNQPSTLQSPRRRPSSSNNNNATGTAPSVSSSSTERLSDAFAGVFTSGSGTGSSAGGRRANRGNRFSREDSAQYPTMATHSSGTHTSKSLVMSIDADSETSSGSSSLPSLNAAMLAYDLQHSQRGLALVGERPVRGAGGDRRTSKVGPEYGVVGSPATRTLAGTDNSIATVQYDKVVLPVSSSQTDMPCRDRDLEDRQLRGRRNSGSRARRPSRPTTNSSSGGDLSGHESPRKLQQEMAAGSATSKRKGTGGRRSSAHRGTRRRKSVTRGVASQTLAILSADVARTDVGQPPAAPPTEDMDSSNSLSDRSHSGGDHNDRDIANITNPCVKPLTATTPSVMGGAGSTSTGGLSSGSGTVSAPAYGGAVAPDTMLPKPPDTR